MSNSESQQKSILSESHAGDHQLMLDQPVPGWLASYTGLAPASGSPASGSKFEGVS